MDNLTHSIIGAAFVRVLPGRFRRPEIYWASVIANNLPDADILVRFLPGMSSFDYLIHHRGYTHTFLAVPILGLVSAAIAKRATRAERWTPALLGVGILGGLLHVAADFLNNYGVHPFSPFLDRWFYGDSVFIVEPLLWFALVPMLAREATRAWARSAWIILGLAMLALVWVFPTFTSGLSFALTLIFAVSSYAAWRFRGPRLGRLIPLALFGIALAAFVGGGIRARTLAREAWAREAPATDESLLDVASSPAPGNPGCWNVWLAAKGAAEYRFYSADVTLFPRIFPIDECGSGRPGAPTAVYAKATFSPSAAVRWNGVARTTFENFTRYREKSPRFRRLLAFARFPFIREFPDGSAIAGDLRYDRESGVGFAEVEIPAAGEAPVADEKRNSPWEWPLRLRVDDRAPAR